MNDLNKIDYESIDKLTDLLNDITERLYRVESSITELKVHLGIETLTRFKNE